MTMCNVLIVDDHPLMRKGIAQLISFEKEFSVVGEASNGADALGIALKVQPDLILLDLNMKGMSGLDTLKALRSEGIEARIVILTVSDSPNDIDVMVKAGADGYLLKDTEPDDLIDLIKESMTGNKIYSDKVRQYFLDKVNKPSLMDLLTEREHQILQEVAKGFRNKQIATSLFISESTVKVHMKSLLKKLEVSSRTAATILYLEHFGDYR